MAIRTVFANESGNQPASQLDNMFVDVWNSNMLSCTVTGTNSLVLTPRSNVNLPTAYVANQRVGFTAGATSTGSMTAQVGSLAALNIYQPGGTQAGSGNIVSGTYYELAYDPALNSGSGGWWMVSATASTPSVAQPLQGGFKNLVITNTTATTAASNITFTADALTVWNSSNGAFTITSFSVTINANAAGANGLDTGSFTASTWYYIWAIYNPTTATAAGLMSASSTAPTMPSGYTYKALYGAIRANATPAFVNMMQKGKRAQNLVGTYNSSALAALPNMGNGTAGTYSGTSPTWASVSVSNFVPTIASEIVVATAVQYKGGTASSIAVAPNGNYAGKSEATNGNFPPYINEGTNTEAWQSFLLEGTSISWCSSAAGGAISCSGWMVNI